MKFFNNNEYAYLLIFQNIFEILKYLKRMMGNTQRSTIGQ